MSFHQPAVIAIDGYSSCGKSTFAKLIAQELNYIYIDSGAMYRAVTLYFMENGILKDDQVNMDRIPDALGKIQIDFTINPDSGSQETRLNGRNVEDEIRGTAVSSVVSKISKISAVRTKMVKFQRMIGNKGGVVMDGRDIGTVVFPEAMLKIFMTADVDIRARRRYDELVAKGLNVKFNEIADNIRMRDHEDENRKESPLVKANDALVLDNSTMSVEQQMKWFRDIWEKITYNNEN